MLFLLKLEPLTSSSVWEVLKMTPCQNSSGIVI